MALKDEVLTLRREIDVLKAELMVANSRAVPEGIEDLAQGAEETCLSVRLDGGRNDGVEIFNVKFRWIEIMRTVLPLTSGVGADAHAIASALIALAHETAINRKLRGVQEDYRWRSAQLTTALFSQVVNQMVALGLVEVEQMNGQEKMWRATHFGMQQGSRLMAIKKGEDPICEGFSIPF